MSLEIPWKELVVIMDGIRSIVDVIENFVDAFKNVSYGFVSEANGTKSVKNDIHENSCFMNDIKNTTNLTESIMDGAGSSIEVIESINVCL